MIVLIAALYGDSIQPTNIMYYALVLGKSNVLLQKNQQSSVIRTLRFCLICYSLNVEVDVFLAEITKLKTQISNKLQKQTPKYQEGRMQHIQPCFEFEVSKLFVFCFLLFVFSGLSGLGVDDRQRKNHQHAYQGFSA
jgi:hypothetical protein